jgi:biopolymer transport protein ExbB/TolQ
MLDFFMQGGLLFMSLLSLLFIGVIVFGIRSFKDSKSLKFMKSIGLLALVVGILGQLIGLFSAFSTMELMEEGISPQILAGGLKVSMITTLYGIFIFIISLVFGLIRNLQAK